MRTSRNSRSVTPSRVATVAILLGLLAAPSLAQKGGGGGGGGKSGGGSSQGSDDSDDTGVPVCPQIVGQHPLLENLTRELRLTCQQEVRILPLMHDEEAVSKPLLDYAALTPEERQALLLKVDLAARARVRPFLLPEQQKKSDEDAASIAGKAPKKSSKKKAQPVSADAFASEEALVGEVAAGGVVVVAGLQQLLDVLGAGLRPDRDPPPPVGCRPAVRGDQAVPGWCGPAALRRSTDAPPSPKCRGDRGPPRRRPGRPGPARPAGPAPGGPHR